MSNDLHLIVGLGNPGAQYAATRHNIGQFVLDLLAARCGEAFKEHPRANAAVAEVRLPSSGGGIPGARVVLAKPLTFMNTSGGPVATLAKYYDLAPEQVIAVHDDVDLPFDTVKLKLGGGEGGHNGLRSISQSLGTRDYLRVRMGVGRPPGRQDTADFVLSRFNTTEVAAMPIFIDDGADAVSMLVTNGLLETQQKFHSP
jgi:peptidyl-tRNA hydrolase, PTH1 family